jgi:cytochrome P450
MELTIPTRTDYIPRLAPGPQEFPEVWSNPLEVFIEASHQYGDIVCLDPHQHRMYLLIHPDHVKYVLQENYRNYRRDADSFKLLIGNGLLANDGASWLRQRRLMQPAFHRQQLAGLASMMTETTALLLAQWQAAAESGQPLDILAEMMTLTMKIIVKTMFSSDIDDEIGTVAEAMIVGEEYVFQQGWDYTEEGAAQAKERFQQAADTLDRMVYGIIDKRRRSRSERQDLLSMLLQARDEETHEGMDDKQLRDEIITIFGAGHATTAITLAWTWYLLDRHPEIEARLQAELATVLGGRLPTFENLPQLSYTRQVIEESLRLYPPGWMTARLSIEADEIGGYHIPPNSEIFLSPYLTHRHPAFWENPEVVDPDRFLPERTVRRPRFAYFPFSGGPRVCIGQSFAMMEAQLIAAIIAQNYRLRLQPGQHVEARPLITLQPHGLLMTPHQWRKP